MLDDVPIDMRSNARWVAWREVRREGKLKVDKVPVNANTLHNASVIVPGDWTSFERAVEVKQSHPELAGVGFALGGGTTGFDLDDCLDDNGNIKDAFAEWVVGEVGSYTEVSPSGKGLHIFVLGDMPADKGVRRKGLEIYGEGRFFTVTGKQFNNNPLTRNQQAINNIVSIVESGRNQSRPSVNWMASDPGGTDYATQETADLELYKTALAAANGDKFLKLWSGQWEIVTDDNGVAYPSQSEADLALMNIIVYYTDSPDQARRMFMRSQLGQRAKAQRVSIVRGYILKAFDMKVPTLVLPDIPFVSSQSIAWEDAPSTEIEIPDITYTPAPGLVGELQTWLYNQSPYAMASASSVAGLSLMAGIVGRQYLVRGQIGLNLYMMLLARTGAGKEAMSSGIYAIINRIAEPKQSTDIGAPVLPGYETALKFLAPGDMTGRGLEKVMARYNIRTCLSIFREFAHKLSSMSTGKGGEGDKQLMKIALEMYPLSGVTGAYLGNINSDDSKKVEPIKHPAFSLLTESTGDYMYSIMNMQLLRTGLLPRFIIVENTTRPVYNKYADPNPPEYITTRVMFLMQKVVSMVAELGDIRQPIPLDEGADKLDDEFHTFTQHKIHNMDLVTGNIWSRAHVNVLKVAGLVAVGCNMTTPVITREIYLWALNFVTPHVQRLVNKFNSGEIGRSDSGMIDLNQEQQISLTKMTEIMRKYLKKHGDQYDSMRSEQTVSRGYLNVFCHENNFRHPQGKDAAIEACLKIMQKDGRIERVKIQKGEGYKILELR